MKPVVPASMITDHNAPDTTYEIVELHSNDGNFGLEICNRSVNGQDVVQIASVYPGSPADQCSLQPGQLVSEINTVPVAGLTDHDLQRLLAQAGERSGRLALTLSTHSLAQMTTSPAVQMLSLDDTPGILSPGPDIPAPERELAEVDEVVGVRVVRKQAYPKLSDASLTADSQSVSGSPLATSSSPLITFKPKHARMPVQSQQLPSSLKEPWSVPHLGAVASLAIDGGLTTDQLMKIGSSSVVVPPSPIRPSQPVFVRRGADLPRFRADHQPFISRFSTPTTSVSSCRVQLHRFANPTHCGRRYEHVSGDVNPASSNPRYRRAFGSPMAGHRQGCLPVQLNRVGGIVVTPNSHSSTDIQQAAPSSCQQQQAGTHKPSPPTAWQSGDEDLDTTSPPLPLTPSSSGTSYYSFSQSPPNFPKEQDDAPHVSTPVVVHSGTTATTGSIVRLGPGDTITYISSPTSVRSNNIIRMHCSPRPYVSSAVPEVKDRAASHDGVAETTGAASGLSSDFGQTAVPLQPDEPPQRHSTPETATLIYRQRSPISPSPISLAMLTAKDFKPTSAPVAHVARTVRHLRRIRHIFGDSLNYSGTSASLGALGNSGGGGLHDRDFCSQCLLPLNTLVTSAGVGKDAVDAGDRLTSVAGITSRSRYRLKSGDNNSNSGCHSVDSVRRPISLESHCSTCLSPISPDIASTKETIVPIRFELVNQFSKKSEASPTTCYTSWNNSSLLVSPNGSLSVSRFANIRVITTLAEEEPVPVPSSLSHFHVGNLTDNWLGWHPLNQLASSPGLPSDLADKRLLVGLLRIPDEPLVVSCQLCFDADCLTSHPLHHWVPLPPPRPVEETAASPVKKQQSATEATRGRAIAGRSYSLGVAGPPGSSLLVKAVGTAAASIGMTLTGNSAYQSMLSQQNAGHGQRLSISGDDKLCDTVASSVPVNGILNKIKVPHSKSPTRPTPGRLQLAFSRMRRATTITSSGPVSESPSTSMVTPPSSVVLDYHELHSDASLSGGPSCPAAAQTDEQAALLLRTVASSAQTCTGDPGASLNAQAVSDGDATNVSSGPDKTTTSNDKDVGTKSAGFEATRSNDRPTTATDTTDFLGDAIHALRSVGKAHSRKAVSMPDEDPAEPCVPRPCQFIPLPAPVTGPMPLHRCPRSTVSPFVPFVVELCVTLVEHFGLNCVGLYRLSGSKVAHDFISTQLGKNLTDIDVNSDKWNDIHAVCGVLKTFLRNLPDSLLPKVMYSDFLSACRLPQRDRRLLSIQRLLSIMECYPKHPEYRAHRATLRYLATHLARVSARQALNKMTTYNLALLFAPNLVQPLEDRPELLMSDSNYKILLLETVIKYHSWIFSPDLGLESGCSIPPDSTEDLSTTELELDTGSRGEQVPSASTPGNPTEATAACSDATLPGRTEGNVQPLLTRLLSAAAGLPPPPSDTDLETAEEPGPASDRPSDVAAGLSPASTRTGDLGGCVQRRAVADPEVARAVDSTDSSDQPLLALFGTKMDSLRDLSQDCLDQYTSEARQLGERVAKGRRDIETTMAQRLLAEQRLFEARSETSVVALPSFPLPLQLPSYSATGCGAATSACSPLVLASRQSPSGGHRQAGASRRPGPTGSLGSTRSDGDDDNTENIGMSTTTTKSSRD